MRVAAPVELSPEQRTALERMARQRSLPARLVERARIVLLAADGLENRQIAQRLRITPEKAARWRSRFLAGLISALQKDAPRPGKPRTITDHTVKKVVEMTLHQKPANATHWSTRTMARAAGISEASVRRIWRAHGLKPHRVRTFKLSNDPEFVEKLEDIVGLYLNPPEHAIVLCADEKSQIQALDRTQPGLPMKKGRCGTMTHDYKRNGTATLFRRPRCVGGRSHLHVRRPAPSSGVAEVPACHRPHRPAGKADSHDRGQLRDPQASQGRALAQPPSPLSHALHANQLLVVEHGGAILPRHDRKPNAPRRLPQR
jgi:transposase